MWWLFGILGALVYVLLLFTMGIASLRNRHFMLFVLGFALPLFWIVGGLWERTDDAAQPA